VQILVYLVGHVQCVGKRWFHKRAQESHNLTVSPSRLAQHKLKLYRTALEALVCTSANKNNLCAFLDTMIARKPEAGGWQVTPRANPKD
jgi:hypothetical protein